MAGGISRREFVGGVVAGAAAMTVPHVHAAGSDTIQVALVGCGGRGSGAAGQALSTSSQGPVKLVAMADVFNERLTSSLRALRNRHGEKVDVPDDRKFIGFDGYKNAIDSLKPNDVAIFATPPAFRWVHFTYAIQKGVNVFMEKPVTVDGPTTRRMLKLAEESEKKDMKVGVGLMCRHCEARKELLRRIKEGQIGEILLLRAYRMGGRAATAGRNRGQMSELMYQIRRFHSFLWASGGLYSDYLIHNIDECCWMKEAWPVKAQASGGRHYRDTFVDQNFDHYSVEYTFGDGTKLFLESRQMEGAQSEFASYAHGSKSMAVISTRSHIPARCRIYKGQNMVPADLVWSFPQPEPDPYQLEWDHLMNAIRNGKKHNEVKRGAEASLVTAMGRMAAHTGQVVTYEQMLNCEHEFAPEVDKLTLNSPAPLKALADGTYPVPQPGIEKAREY